MASGGLRSYYSAIGQAGATQTARVSLGGRNLLSVLLENRLTLELDE